MQLIVDGLKTNYQRQGEGKQLLVLHGWGDNSVGWRTFAAELSKNYDVIVPDLPGFGGTDAPLNPWGLNEYASFVASFTAKADIKPFGIIGHSNGAAIAIRGLANKVLAADKLVLLSSAGIRGEYKGRNKALRIVTKVGKLVATPLPATVKKRLQRKVYSTVGSDMLVAEHLQETFKRVVEDDVRADAARLKLPALLIYGVNDPATPIRYAHMLHDAITGSQLEIVDDAEHFVHLDKADEVQSLVQEFLS